MLVKNRENHKILKKKKTKKICEKCLLERKMAANDLFKSIFYY